MKTKMVGRIILTAGICAVMLLGAGFAFAEEVPDETLTAEQETADGIQTWTKAGLKKAALKNLKATSASYDKIKISWDGLENVDGYEVFRSLSKNGKYEKVKRLKGETKNSFTDENRTCGKTCWYKVRAYKKIDGKEAVTLLTEAKGAYAKPAKVIITDAYAPSNSGVTGAVKYKPVRGATDYEVQINRIKPNGKETGFRSYTYNDEGKKCTFDTYKTMLVKVKKMYPKGYASIAKLENGKTVSRKYTVEELAAEMVPENTAEIEMLQDESTYQFRVRAYRKVNGKKIYGSWSKPYTLRETLNLDEIRQELRRYAIDYAAENEPRWHYDDGREGTQLNHSNYYVDGAWPGFSIYSKQEDVIRGFKPVIARYIRQVVKQGGADSGFLYLSRVGIGDWEDAFSKNKGPGVYCNIFMLY